LAGKRLPQGHARICRHHGKLPVPACKYRRIPRSICFGRENTSNLPGSGVPGTPLAPTPNTPVSPPTYRVIICLDDVVIDDTGFNYKPGDTITIPPDNGSLLEPIINQRGEIVKVNLISKGCGFVDLPEIVVESATGFNAIIKPILNVTRVINEQDLLEVPPGIELISVVDCVGIIPPKKA